MTRRAANNKELEAYLEKTAKEGTTRELNGNIVITQGEMLEEVFLPLRAQLPATSYQLMLVQYLQSLLHAQIPAQPQL